MVQLNASFIGRKNNVCVFYTFGFYEFMKEFDNDKFKTLIDSLLFDPIDLQLGSYPLTF